jgi:bacillithiol system protein YtxJ
MGFSSINNNQEFEAILEKSALQPQVIFKHSTRCYISSSALKRMNGCIENPSASYSLLDLIAHREISSAIATQLNVEHQSPQAILISEGKVIKSWSHEKIDAETILLSIQQLKA